MKVVRASSLDAHDRRRFNELRRNVFADGVVELEFDRFVEAAHRKVQIFGRRLKLVRKKK